MRTVFIAALVFALLGISFAGFTWLTQSQAPIEPRPNIVRPNQTETLQPGLNPNGPAETVAAPTHTPTVIPSLPPATPVATDPTPSVQVEAEVKMNIPLDVTSTPAAPAANTIPAAEPVQDAAEEGWDKVHAQLDRLEAKGR